MNFSKQLRILILFLFSIILLSSFISAGNVWSNSRQNVGSDGFRMDTPCTYWWYNNMCPIMHGGADTCYHETNSYNIIASEFTATVLTTESGWGPLHGCGSGPLSRQFYELDFFVPTRTIAEWNSFKNSNLVTTLRTTNNYGGANVCYSSCFSIS